MYSALSRDEINATLYLAGADFVLTLFFIYDD